MKPALLVFVALLAVAGCGDETDGGDGGEPQPAAPAQAKPEPKPGRGDFTGQAGEVYLQAKVACGLGDPAKTASDFGIDSDVSDAVEAGEVAEAYAHGYTEPLQQPAFEGCFNGITKAAGLGAQ